MWRVNCRYKKAGQLRGGLAGRMVRAGLALCLTVAFIPAPALASSAGEDDGTAEVVASPDVTEAKTVEVTAAEETYVPDPDLLPDSDELFAGYVERTFYGSNDVMPLADYYLKALTDAEQSIYGVLKNSVSEVAKGTLNSAEFVVGTSDMEISYNSGTYLDSEGVTVDCSKVVRVLMVDCPFELYWYDKTEGFVRSTTTITASDKISVESIHFSFSVASAYNNGEITTVQFTDHTDSYYFGVDVAKTSAAANAVTNARAVVGEFENQSDYEKLVAYKEWICEAVSYNEDAAKNDYTGGYGDPWQLIYVFDDDSTTNVVCEGYSKAFQYLCDLSTFSGDVTCYTVSGTMTGGTGAGPHMWNVVSLGDANYLVDVTNSDEGASGASGGLFLNGYSSGSVSEGYTFVVGSGTASVNYKYDSDVISLYGQGILALSDRDYIGSEANVVASVSVGSEQSSYTDFASAMRNAQTKSSEEVQATVTLLQDVDLGNSYVTVASGNIVLKSEINEGSETHTVSGTAENLPVILVQGGTLTLESGTVSGLTYGVVVDGGTFVVSGGAVVGVSRGVYVSGGTFDMSGGTVKATTTMAEDGYGISTAGTTTVTGGMITGTYVGLYVSSEGSAVLSGGTYSGAGLASVYDAASYNNDERDPGALLSEGASYWQDETLYTPSSWYISGDVTVRPAASIYGATLTLDGSIGVNFYVDMSSIDEGTRDGYKMKFKVNGADVDSVSYNPSATNTFSDAVYHRFTCSVNSCQMNDAITAQLYCGDTPVSKAYTYSVKTYADHMISAGSNSKLVSLVKAMLNYGGYAQTYFPTVSSSSPANSGLVVEDGYSVENVVANNLVAHRSSSTGSTSLDVKASLVLNSETAIRFYFSPKDVDISDCTFKVDETPVEPKGVVSSPDDSDSGSSATHYIEIPNIAASQLDTMHTLTVSDGSSTMTLSYSALSYAYDVVNDGSADESLQNLVKALYLYNQAANAYFEA